MKLVYISFPLSCNFEYNKEEADKYCKYVYEHRLLPITSMAVIEQLKRISSNKAQIFNKKLELIKRCDELWYFKKEPTFNMIKEIEVAKSSNISVRYIDIEENLNRCSDMESYQSEFKKIKKLYNYQKYLKEVNDLVYSEDLYTIDYGLEFDLESRIKHNNILSEVQRRYLLNKLHSYPFTFGYLDKGYKYIWNLNNNVRNYTLYIRTMYYIRSLEWGDKKIGLMRKIFNFVKKDNFISEHRKKKIVEDLYNEIVKKIPNNFTLNQIYRYEDIYDIMGVFLEG